MSERTQRRLAAIVSADVVGYSRLVGADETGTLAALRANREELIDPLIADHGGRIVKTMGDGLLLEFPSVVNAVQCSIEMQNQMGARNAEVPDGKRIIFRIGVNLGDIIIEGDDILGDGVNVAARLQEIAEPGGIAISRRVHEDVQDRLDASFEDAGEQTLKNIARPVQVWRWSPAGSSPDTKQETVSAEALPLPDKPSIAVLPFDNMSGDPEQEYFSDGICEDIITMLSKISGLFVIARNSTFTYKGAPVMPQKVASELGIRYVLEGSVRKAGNRVRITAQLIDGTTGGHLWAERYDRELTDIFAVQDEVTEAIVAALALTLTEDEKARFSGKETDNLEAYDYFLRGRELWLRLDQETNRQARVMLERAGELDPGFSLTFAYLGMTYVFECANNLSDSPSQALDTAHALAKQAVALDESEPHAHVALGATYLWRRQHELAIAEAERAVALDPNYAHAYFDLAMIHHYAGRSEVAIGLFDKAMRLDPHYLDLFLHWRAQAHFQLAQYDEAAQILRRRLIRSPRSDSSRVLLAACLGYLGQPEEARSIWAEAMEINPDLSIEQRRATLPYKDPADFERIVNGLRRAGLPE